MKVSLTDSLYIEVKPTFKEVYINEESNDFFVGYCYISIFLFTCYIKRYL